MTVEQIEYFASIDQKIHCCTLLSCNTKKLEVLQQILDDLLKELENEKDETKIFSLMRQHQKVKSISMEIHRKINNTSK